MAPPSPSPSLPTPDRPTILLNAPDLATSPHLLPLHDLLNSVYRHAHLHGRPGTNLLPDSVGRLEAGPPQLISELGPDGFCFLMFDHHHRPSVDSNSTRIEHVERRSNGAETAETSAPPGKLVACACAKPYRPTQPGESHGSELNMMFKRPPPPPAASAATTETSADKAPPARPEDDDDDQCGSLQSEWELLAFAVDVPLQGQGIAAHLTRLCEGEIRTRVARQEEDRGRGRGREGGSEGQRGSGERPRIVLMLSSLKELNEAYYLKRGWTATAERRMPEGTGGGDAFSAVEMVRVLD